MKFIISLEPTLERDNSTRQHNRHNRLSITEENDYIFLGREFKREIKHYEVSGWNDDSYGYDIAIPINKLSDVIKILQKIEKLRAMK